jgi:hypothetical protein
MISSRRRSDTQAVEARLGLRLAAGLAERAEDLPHDVSERLRAAREQALTHARAHRRVPAAAVGTVVLGGGGGAATLGASTPWWQRLASLLPLLVLVAGLIAIDQFSEQEQVRAAAEIDAMLLADDLPPTAYSDPGFAEYLRTSPP